ncbi:antibiotic biosynthesis monooxygenase [Planctomycetaceae bacterium SH139]
METRPVHVAVTRIVRDGSEAEFERLLKQFISRSLDVPGSSGVLVLRPPADSEAKEYGLMRSFEDEDAATAFYDSKLFAQWLASIEPLVVGEPVRRRLSGLEAFFRGGTSMPPRWKMAIVTFLGVLPAVLVWSNVLGPLMADLHWLVGAIATNIAVVATLTWGVMPILTKLFHRWLHPTE